MSLQAEPNLKKLIEAVPHGYFVDSKWLTDQGISRQLASRYVESGWLTRVARGLYQRPSHPAGMNDATSDWEHLVLSMQNLMGLNVHVGGTTALQRQGHSHYAPLSGKDRVFLYASKIPGWAKTIETTARFEFRSHKLFKTDLEEGSASLTEKMVGVESPQRWQLIMSSPERSILEALDELPDSESFHNLDMIFQGLVNLRPRRIRALLAGCNSVQVKRLFFVFADRHRHAWRKHISAEEINLGSGDRSFIKGGKLHPEYRITVPPELLPTVTEDQNES